MSQLPNLIAMKHGHLAVGVYGGTRFVPPQLRRFSIELNGGERQYSTNALRRFFKVRVEMP